jgi:hypothetical protein
MEADRREGYLRQPEPGSQRRIVRWLGRLLCGSRSRGADLVARHGQGSRPERTSSTQQPAGADNSREAPHDWSYWDGRLAENLAARLARLKAARAPVKGAAVNYGASNFPSDSTVWLPDWRDTLADGDPRRDIGPPIVQIGTPEAYHKMDAAHNAIRCAYGLPPDPGLDATTPPPVAS